MTVLLYLFITKLLCRVFEFVMLMLLIALLAYAGDKVADWIENKENHKKITKRVDFVQPLCYYIVKLRENNY